VIGDNNIGLLLVWNYSFEAEERILRIAFESEIQPTEIAKKDDNLPFVLTRGVLLNAWKNFLQRCCY